MRDSFQMSNRFQVSTLNIRQTFLKCQQSHWISTLRWPMLRYQCVLYLVKRIKNFRTYPVVSNSKVPFAYSTVISIIPLFNYYFDYSNIPSFHYCIFEISIVQLFPLLDGRLHPHLDCRPDKLSKRRPQPEPD